MGLGGFAPNIHCERGAGKAGRVIPAEDHLTTCPGLEKKKPSGWPLETVQILPTGVGLPLVTGSS